MFDGLPELELHPINTYKALELHDRSSNAPDVMWWLDFNIILTEFDGTDMVCMVAENYMRGIGRIE